MKKGIVFVASAFVLLGSLQAQLLSSFLQASNTIFADQAGYERMKNQAVAEYYASVRQEFDRYQNRYSIDDLGTIQSRGFYVSSSGFYIRGNSVSFVDFEQALGFQVVEQRKKEKAKFRIADLGLPILGAGLFMLVIRDESQFSWAAPSVVVSLGAGLTALGIFGPPAKVDAHFEDVVTSRADPAQLAMSAYKENRKLLKF